MSEPKWTPAQRAAIEDRGGALLVSAAAGSGKTAVLTERAVRLITDPEHPVDADRLLIVTFTNAAAAELRARIGQALLKRSQAEPGNGALRRQRMLLQRAPICTIDAFCLDLLRKHFQALDIPPDFSPADPGSVELLRASALSETLENAYRDPDFCAFADLYGKGRTDRAAGETILHVYDFLRALPDYDKKLDEFLAPWQEENGFAASCWHDLLLAEAARSARAAGELFRAALADCPGDREQELADAEEKKTPSAREKAKNAVLEKYTDAQERLDKAAALLGRVEQLAVAGEWTPLYDLLTPYVLGMEELPGLKGMKKRLNGEHKKVIRARADEGAALFAQILELIPCSEEEAEADRRAAEPRLRALFAAVRDFDARFSAKKRDRKLLEFSDFEHQALRLLRDPDGTPTALCGVIRQNYAAVMVDEYQDTNALQDALYRCLASPAGDDLFLVGDLKQSIYRFRQADPSIFREKLDSWPALPGGTARPRPAEEISGTDAILALDANFRSAPQVVEGINFLFERLMSPELGDTAYGDGQRLVCGAPGEYTGSVEAHFLPDDTAETDAGWIARRIEEMVQSGEPVREGSATRPVQYEDCCILLAARIDFPAYVEALTDRGIPVYADARENLLDAPHIRPLIALLKVIDNPAQDIYLAAAMLGPLFGFTDDDLVRLRARAEEIQKQQGENAPQRISLYGALLLTVGMGLFSLGAEQSMTLIGSRIGTALTKTKNLPLILGVSFLLGFAITVAEPDLQVLAGTVPHIEKTVLLAVVGAGVGLFMSLCMVRILYGIRRRWVLLLCYAVVFALAAFTDKNFLSIAFDSGGVTTGPMTVPFILALGLGVSNIRSDSGAKADSFGLVALCSIGPILAVLILGLFYRDSSGVAELTEVSYASTTVIGSAFLGAIPVYLKEMAVAMLPIVGIFLTFQLAMFRMNRRSFWKIMVGILYTYVGLVLFLPGVNFGFSSLGAELGAALAEGDRSWLLIPLAALLGWFIISAEPAVGVLEKQIEDVSAGAIPGKTIKASLSVAIALAMAFSMLALLTCV